MQGVAALLEVLDVDAVVSVTLLEVNDTLLTDASGSFFSGVTLLTGDVTVALGGEFTGGIGLNPWTLLASANVVGDRLFLVEDPGAATTCGPLGGILGSILTSTILFWAVFSCNVGCCAKLMLIFDGGEVLLSVLSCGGCGPAWLLLVLLMMDFVYPSPFPLSSLVSRIFTMSWLCCDWLARETFTGDTL